MERKSSVGISTWPLIANGYLSLTNDFMANCKISKLGGFGDEVSTDKKL